MLLSCTRFYTGFTAVDFRSILSCDLGEMVERRVENTNNAK
jgi:hypothetical protein